MNVPITSIIAISIAFLALGMNIGRMMKSPDEERNYYVGYTDCQNEYGFPPPAHGKN